MAYLIKDLDSGDETPVDTDKELMTTVLRLVKTFDKGLGWPLLLGIEDVTETGREND